MGKTPLYLTMLVLVLLVLAGCKLGSHIPCEIKGNCPPKPSPSPEEECAALVKPGGAEAFMIGFCKIIGSCEEVDLKVQHTPEVDLHTYQTIAFTTIEGDYGNAFSSAYKEQVQNNSHLKVLDRTQFKKLMKERDISQQELFKPEMRVKRGLMLPGGLLVTGNIESSYHESEPNNPQKIPCPYDSKKLCTLNTRSGTAIMKGTISIIDVETGQQIKDKRLYHKTEKSNTSLNQAVPEPIAQETLHETNLQTIVYDMTIVTVPWNETRKVVFFADSDLRKLEVGILMAKGGRLVDAEKNFTEAIEEAESKPGVSLKALAAAQYNLALIKAYRGDYENSEKLLKKVMEATLDTFPAAKMMKVMDCRKKDEERRKQNRNHD